MGADPGRQRRDPVVPQVQPGEVGQQLEEVGGEGAEGVALQVQLLQSRDERRSAAGLGGKRGVHPHMAHGRRGGRRAECQGPALGRGDCPCALTPGGRATPTPSTNTLRTELAPAASRIALLPRGPPCSPVPAATPPVTERQEPRVAQGRGPRW